MSQMVLLAMCQLHDISCRYIMLYSSAAGMLLLSPWISYPSRQTACIGPHYPDDPCHNVTLQEAHSDAFAGSANQVTLVKKAKTTSLLLGA